MPFTDRFGGSSVQPADVGYRAVALSASITTVWPAYATTGNELARNMEVTPSGAGFSVTLPDATLTTKGMDALFSNLGASSFTVLDDGGNTVATLTAGQVKYLYLADNSTANGTWRVVLFGVGASSPDASQLVGDGLKAIGATLNFAPVVVPIAIDTTLVTGDRANVYVWSGGSGILTLPTTAGSTSDWSVEVRNQGTGTLTLTPVGGALVDGSGTVALSVNESCFIHMGAVDWYTVGRGRSALFNFTQLQKVVDGGSDTLTLTESSNVVQTYTGVLLANQTITLPAVVQVYYVINNTTGAYTLTFACAGGGTSVVVNQTQAAVLFVDGTNVINANTQLAGAVTTVIFGAGTAANPSVAIGTANKGFYSPAADQVGASIAGAQVGLWETTGYTQTGAGTISMIVKSTAAAAVSAVQRVAGQLGSFRLRTGLLDRWALIMDAVAESGANAGSNLSLTAYDDAGASLGTVFTVNRATRALTFTVPAANAVGTITRDARTSNTILSGADVGKLIDITSGTFSQTLTAAATLGSGWFVYYKNSGTGTITLDPDGAELINGATTFVVPPGNTILLQCTGTAFTVVVAAPSVMRKASIFSADTLTLTPLSAGEYVITNAVNPGLTASIHLGVTSNGSLLMAFGIANGSSSDTASSPDGLVWTLRALGSSSQWQCCSDGTGFLAFDLATSTTVKYSATGSSWAAATALPGASAFIATSACSRTTAEYVVRGTASTTTLYKTVDNGTNWTTETAPAASQNTIVTVGGLYVAGASSNTYYTSATGATGSWTSRTLPGSSTVFGKRVSDNACVCYSASGTYVTTDGINWTLETASVTTYAANFNGVYLYGTTAVPTTLHGSNRAARAAQTAVGTPANYWIPNYTGKLGTDIWVGGDTSGGSGAILKCVIVGTATGIFS